jgi:hypothetical protein
MPIVETTPQDYGIGCCGKYQIDCDNFDIYSL